MIDFNQSKLWHAATGMPKGIFAGQTLSIVDEDQPCLLPYLQQNLALHVGDDVQQVQYHRMQLLNQLSPYGVRQLCWLNQTHSTMAYQISNVPTLDLREGDGLVTQQKGIGLVMMTADCLPIVISDEHGQEIACVHAGWRGLAEGIIEATAQKMQFKPAYAWIGAAISQENFEVGKEVKFRFTEIDQEFDADFMQKANGKYLADLYSIATKKLKKLGVQAVSGANHCSFNEQDKFYSYRRQSHTGRMATFVFISLNC